jgi:hypothetical protein
MGLRGTQLTGSIIYTLVNRRGGVVAYRTHGGAELQHRVKRKNTMAVTKVTME